MHSVPANTEKKKVREIGVELRRFRRSDVQAAYSLVLAAVSVVPFLVAAALVARNYDPVLGRIVYGSLGQFVPVFLGCVLLSLAPGAVGFVLGWSSALQRRNERLSWSWAGFFLGGTILTADFILLLAFYMIRLERVM